ncbi:hypothetical protein ACHAWX_003701 [Stephanocyclus meneghinianus]
MSEYKKSFGNCNAPLKFSENPSLGIWVNERRLQHRNGLVGKRPPLTVFQKTIGFQWAPVFHVSWEERLRQLVEFKHITRNCHVTTKVNQISRWVNGSLPNAENLERISCQKKR